MKHKKTFIIILLLIIALPTALTLLNIFKHPVYVLLSHQLEDNNSYSPKATVISVTIENNNFYDVLAYAEISVTGNNGVYKFNSTQQLGLVKGRSTEQFEYSIKLPNVDFEIERLPDNYDSLSIEEKYMSNYYRNFKNRKYYDDKISNTNVTVVVKCKTISGKVLDVITNTL